MYEPHTVKPKKRILGVIWAKGMEEDVFDQREQQVQNS